MHKTFLIGILLVAVFAVGCSHTDEYANANANPATRTGPDNSEITSSVDASGTKTETRTFKNNPNVSKVVVRTTKEGKRTVKVYSQSGQEKEVTGPESEGVLETTGEKVASGAGFVADKAEDVGGEVKDGAETAADKTAETAKDVANKTVDTTKDVTKKTADVSKTVGEKTASGTKKAVKETESGVKKAGSAVKKVIP